MTVEERNERCLTIQMEIRKLSFLQDEVEKFETEYYELEHQKEILQDEYYQLWGMSDEEIKEQDEQTNKNRDKE